jgi:Zn finger protein HypA/HybF involved in hydrogenase expression
LLIVQRLQTLEGLHRMAQINRQYVDVACNSCDWQRSCPDAQMVEMLRAIRKVGVSKAPGSSILIEIFKNSLAEMLCPACGGQGLHVAVVAENDDEDWPEGKTCDGCGRPIEQERMEAVPDSTLCVACQKATEQGDTTVEQEYCEKCGSPVQLVLSGGRGISRYVLRCSGGCR